MQTYVQYLCIKNSANHLHVRGQLYYFHEDEAVDENFEMVISEKDFPKEIHTRDEEEIDESVVKYTGHEDHPKVEKHSTVCDIDPKTLTWKRDIPGNEIVNVCRACEKRILAKRKKR